MSYKLVGTIVKPKGLTGQFSLRGFPEDMADLSPGVKIKIGYSETFSKIYTIRSWEKKSRVIIVALEEIGNPEDLRQFKEMGVFVSEEDIKYADSDKFFVDELVGCSVFNIQTNEYIGKVSEVLVLEANDVWFVDTERGQLPLPVIDDVIKNVDLLKRKIEVELIPGLMDLIND